MVESVADIVSLYLDVQSLGRFSRACKQIREIVGRCELAWQMAFEKLSGTTKISDGWPSGERTWKDHVKTLVSVDLPFKQNQEGTLFTFGAWKIAFLGEATWLFTEKQDIVVELNHTSNGWWRFIWDGNGFVCWPSAAKNKQEFSTEELTSFVESNPEPRLLFIGARCSRVQASGWNSDEGEKPNLYEITVAEGGLKIMIDGTPVFLSKDEPRLSTCSGHVLINLPKGYYGD